MATTNNDSKAASSSNAAKTNGETTKLNGQPGVVTPKPNGAATKSEGSQELTGAQKKALAKAEKAARRAKDKGEPVPQAGKTEDAQTAGRANSVLSQSPVKKDIVQKPSALKSDAASSQAQNAKRRPSVAAAKPAQLPARPKTSAPAAKDTSSSSSSSKQVSFLAHLYGQTRRQTLAGASKDVHPAIQALGLQFSSYTICGSHARCVATMLALKSVVQSYTTPPGTSLARHLSASHLSHQLSHLKSCRPFSTSQSNSIRWLKNLIANIDPSVPEATAKQSICEAIDTFLHERFTVADRVIADAAATQIKDGDVILTYAKSAVVHATLLAAQQSGTRFRVVVVDSRPLYEGRHFARALVAAGIPVTYSLITALSHAARGATRCLLGAHAVLGNGRIYSRTGSALVAMTAKSENIPVVVCAESVKFTERVALDAIVLNELAPEEELTGSDVLRTDGDGKLPTLDQWRDLDGLQVLNLMYDVTPAEYVDEIVTELGALPPSAAPAVQRISAVGGME